MTESILISSTSKGDKFANPIAVRFFEYLEEAADESATYGNVTLPTLEKIVGDEPIIPSSPDMDARVEAYEELHQYLSTGKNILALIGTYAKKIGS